MNRKLLILAYPQFFVNSKRLGYNRDKILIMCNAKTVYHTNNKIFFKNPAANYFMFNVKQVKLARAR